MWLIDEVHKVYLRMECIHTSDVNCTHISLALNYFHFLSSFLQRVYVGLCARLRVRVCVCVNICIMHEQIVWEYLST